jgi:hypothetical protein
VLTLVIGFTFGASAWSAIRGRGGLPGLALSLLMGAIGSSVGWLAGQALVEDPSPGVLGFGAAMGGLLVAIVAVVGWGPRPRVTVGAAAVATAAAVAAAGAAAAVTPVEETRG